MNRGFFRLWGRSFFGIEIGEADGRTTRGENSGFGSFGDLCGLFAVRRNGLNELGGRKCLYSLRQLQWQRFLQPLSC